MLHAQPELSNPCKTMSQAAWDKHQPTTANKGAPARVVLLLDCLKSGTRSSITAGLLGMPHASTNNQVNSQVSSTGNAQSFGNVARC
jgi:hypothetical protein